LDINGIVPASHLHPHQLSRTFVGVKKNISSQQKCSFAQETVPVSFEHCSPDWHGSIFREASLNCEEVNALKQIVLAFVLVLSLFAVTSLAAEMTGFISDSKCGAKGEKDAHADCAVKCVKGGAAPVFVSDGKVYKIDDAAKVQDHVGHKVTITGEVKGDTIQVQDVKM
jgi:hypothetical protein